MLEGEQARQLFEFLQNSGSEPELSPLEDYVKMLTLLFEEVYQNVEPLELTNEAARLRDHLVASYVKMQKQRIARELQTASAERAQQLLGAAKKLDSLLKQPKN